MRVLALYYAVSVPNIQIFLFRRLSEDLKKNHLDGSSGFVATLSEMLIKKLCSINYSTAQITFWNGAKIHLCHCQHEKDVIKYQGVEINVLLIDELTHFSEYIYKFLRGRVRLGGLQVPKDLMGHLPRIVAGSNPGGVGHEFVKSTFIDDYDPLDLYQMANEEGGMIRQFIPAKLTDNPTMMENDPTYGHKLLGLGGALAKAMLEGDWDAIEGAYFDTFNKDQHIIEDFIIPAHWFRVRAFDWGYSKPFCVLWGAVSDGQLVNVGGREVFIPKDAVVIYREFYGWNGKPNVGLKMELADIGKQTKEMQNGEEMNIQVADPAIFDESRKNMGMTQAEELSKYGCSYIRADNKRVAGWQQIRGRLKGIDNKPLLYIFNSCKSLIRTLPVMQYDKSKPEDLNSDLEDHAVDTLRYLCMSRPITIEAEKTLPEIAEQWWKDFNPHNVRKK